MKLGDDVVYAVRKCDYEALKRLLTADTANATDRDGFTPLIYAVLAENASTTMVQFLIDSGADPNQPDSAGWTPLHYAAREQLRPIVEVLISNGAAVDPTDEIGSTPLHRLVADPRADPVVAALLRSFGANPNHKNSNGKSPIDAARIRGREDILEVPS